MVVSKKSVHERKYFVTDIIFNDLVDLGVKIVAFGTNLINIPIIYAYSDGPLLFVNMNNIGNPISQGNVIDKTYFKQFFNLSFDRSNL